MVIVQKRIVKTERQKLHEIESAGSFTQVACAELIIYSARFFIQRQIIIL